MRRNTTTPIDALRLHLTVLLDCGIDCDLLEACLAAAEQIIAEPELNRWPSVPVRAYGANGLRTGPFVGILPDAANDDISL